MKIVIGSDHGGYTLKTKIIEHLKVNGHDVEDEGTHSEESCDYPDYAKKVAQKVIETGSLGILVCGTGIGMSMVANKVDGIRAALCYDDYTATMAREHNNANILCLGERTTSSETAIKIVDIFLKTKPSTLDRHIRRVEKIC